MERRSQPSTAAPSATMRSHAACTPRSVIAVPPRLASQSCRGGDSTQRAPFASDSVRRQGRVVTARLAVRERLSGIALLLVPSSITPSHPAAASTQDYEEPDGSRRVSTRLRSSSVCSGAGALEKALHLH